MPRRVLDSVFKGKITVGEWNPNFEMDSATRTIWYDQDPNWKPACFKCGSTKNQRRLSSQLYYCAGEQHWVEPDDQVLSAPIIKGEKE